VKSNSPPVGLARTIIVIDGAKEADVATRSLCSRRWYKWWKWSLHTYLGYRSPTSKQTPVLKPFDFKPGSPWYDNADFIVKWHPFFREQDQGGDLHSTHTTTTTKTTTTTTTIDESINHLSGVRFKIMAVENKCRMAQKQQAVVALIRTCIALHCIACWVQYNKTPEHTYSHPIAKACLHSRNLSIYWSTVNLLWVGSIRTRSSAIQN
jgi:hypothetical protein